MLLLVDIGNTRIKWAWFDGEALGPTSAVAHVDWTVAEIKEQLIGSQPAPAQVFVANVAGPKLAALLAEATHAAWSLVPQFVHATQHAANVSNGYQIAEQLGVDRWLGVIAAYHLIGGAACVVNVGTAMTIDAVDQIGRHLGGVIVPGPVLMQRSLFSNTSEIAARAQSGTVAGELFADNTQGAVSQGITHGLAALVERAQQDLAVRINSPTSLFVTGGAADRVTSAMRVPFQTVPNLVLLGLARIALEQTHAD